MDDLNYQLKVSAKPEVDSGLSLVEQRFAKSRSVMETPIRSTLDFDTSPIEVAERSWSKIKRQFATPLKINVDSSAIDAATKRATEAAAKATPRGLGVATVDSPSFVARRFAVSQRDDQENRVREIMAGTIKGMERRAAAVLEAAKLAEAEVEARRRLFGASAGREVKLSEMARGDIEGPAVRGRFSPSESAARSRQAEFLRGNGRGTDAESLAIRSTRGRLTDNLADFGVDAGNGYNAQGDTGRFTPSRLSRSGRAAGAGGGKGDVLKGLANTLPGLGPAGVILMGLNAVANAPEIIKNTHTNVQNYGAVGGIASSVGDALGVGDISRNIRQTFESVVSPNMAKAQQRERDQQDARREMQEKLAAKREKDNAYLSPVLENLGYGARANRQAAALSGLRDEMDIRKVQLEQGYQNEGAGFDAQLRQGREQKLSPDAMIKLEQEVADARIASSEKYNADLARLNEDLARRNADVERQSKNDSNDRLFSIQQSIAEAQGNVFGAELDRINQAADKAVELANQRLADAARDYGAGSPEERAARLGLKDAQSGRDAATRFLVPEAKRKANLAAGDSLYTGFQMLAQFGDQKAAMRAAELQIDKATVERKRELDGLIASNALTEDRLKDLKKQRDEMPVLEAKQRKLAQDQIQIEEHARRGGLVGSLNSIRGNELRRMADRTGNRSFSLQADAIGVGDEYRQRVDDLRAQLATAKSDEERTAISDLIKAVPAQFESAISDLTRSRLSESDYTGSANARAVDAGGLMGYAQSAQETSLARFAQAQTDSSASLKEIVGILRNYFKPAAPGTTPEPLPLTYKRN